MDFDDLRKIVSKAVLDSWDHVTLLAPDDPLGPAILAVQVEAPERVVRLRGRRTAEVMTGEAGDAIERALPPGIDLARVTIRETPSCGSAITRSRQ